MGKTIKVLVHGTGFAGQGHAEAFRYAGAEVVGIVGRTESVVQSVSKDMNIPYAGTDWQKALERLPAGYRLNRHAGRRALRAHQASHRDGLSCF